MPELARGVEDLPPTQPAISQHQNSGYEKPRGAHERRRDFFDRDGNGEVRRSPEEIDQPEGKRQGPSVLVGLCHVRDLRLNISDSRMTDSVSGSGSRSIELRVRSAELRESSLGRQFPGDREKLSPQRPWKKLRHRSPMRMVNRASRLQEFWYGGEPVAG